MDNFRYEVVEELTPSVFNVLSTFQDPIKALKDCLKRRVDNPRVTVMRTISATDACRPLE